MSNVYALFVMCRKKFNFTQIKQLCNRLKNIFFLTDVTFYLYFKDKHTCLRSKKISYFDIGKTRAAFEYGRFMTFAFVYILNASSQRYLQISRLQFNGAINFFSHSQIFALICFVLNFLSKDDASTRLKVNEKLIVVLENGIYLAYLVILFGLLLGNLNKIIRNN